MTAVLVKVRNTWARRKKGFSYNCSWGRLSPLMTVTLAMPTGCAVNGSLATLEMIVHPVVSGRMGLGLTERDWREDRVFFLYRLFSSILVGGAWDSARACSPYRLQTTESHNKVRRAHSFSWFSLPSQHTPGFRARSVAKSVNHDQMPSPRLRCSRAEWKTHEDSGVEV